MQDEKKQGHGDLHEFHNHKTPITKEQQILDMTTEMS